MGHKVHPGGLRVGIIHTWKSNWFTTDKDFSGYLAEDFTIRDHIYGKLSHAGLSDIHIRKDNQRVTVDIYTARPGIVIGKSGSEVDALRKELHDMTGKSVQVNITEISAWPRIAIISALLSGWPIPPATSSPASSARGGFPVDGARIRAP